MADYQAAAEEIDGSIFVHERLRKIKQKYFNSIKQHEHYSCSAFAENSPKSNCPFFASVSCQDSGHRLSKLNEHCHAIHYPLSCEALLSGS